MPKSIFPFLKRLFSFPHKLAEIFCPPLSFKKKTDAPVHILPQFIFLKMGIIPDKGLPKSALIPLSPKSYLGGKKCFSQLLSPVAYLYYGPRQWKLFLLCYFHMAISQFAAQPPQSLTSNFPELHLILLSLQLQHHQILLVHPLFQGCFAPSTRLPQCPTTFCISVNKYNFEQDVFFFKWMFEKFH